MANLAEIGFAADTSALKGATSDLKAMAPAAKAAESAVKGADKALDDLGGAAARAAAGMRSESKAMDDMARGARVAEGAVESAAAANDMAAKSIGSYSAAMGRANSFYASFNANQRVGIANMAATTTGANNVSVSFNRMTNSLNGISPAANKAANDLNKVTTAANDNVAAMRHNTGNIAAQFQDIGVTAAMGMSPLMIALQQGTQLSAVFAQSGTSAFASIAGAIKQVISPTALLTIGIVALISYVIQLGMEFFNTGEKSKKLADAFDTAAFSTYALNDAQGILSGVFDMTTGKIMTQTGALHDLARAQLLAAKAQSMARMAEHNTTLNTMAGETGRDKNLKWWQWNPTRDPRTGGWSAGTRGATFTAQIAQGVQSGQVKPDQAMDLLSGMQSRGEIGNEFFNKSLGAVTGVGVERENQKVYDEALGSLESGKLATRFQTPASSSSNRSSAARPKRDPYADIIGDAKREKLAMEERVKFLAQGEDAVKRYDASVKLLNEAKSRDIKLTDDQTMELIKLGMALADAEQKIKDAETWNDLMKTIGEGKRDISDAAGLIGLYGEALSRATHEQRLFNEAASKGLTRDRMTPEQVAKLQSEAAGLARGEQANATKQFLADMRKSTDDAIWLMERERGEIGLTGVALMAWRRETELLNQARRAGIELTPEEIAATKAAAGEYAAMAYAIDETRQNIEFVKDTARGFIDDLRSGLAEGKSLWDAFGDAVIGVLGRIIDKMLEASLNSLFDQGSSGGGWLASAANFLGGLFKNAKGNAFGSNGVMGFANGGAFTNSIVTEPTLFQYANGGTFGEMGEAGPEAIMPLERGPDGTLGVHMFGGGGPGGGAPVQRVELVIRGEAGPLFVPTVEAIADDRAVKVTTSAISEYNDHLPDRMQEIGNDPRAR